MSGRFIIGPELKGNLTHKISRLLNGDSLSSLPSAPQQPFYALSVMLRSVAAMPRNP